MLDLRLDNKIAIVTGSSRGIGKAVAIAMAQQGADIISVSTNPQPGSELESEIRNAGRNFYSYRCDMSDRKSLYEFIRQVTSDHLKIDILVNNAGNILREPAISHPDDYWDSVLDTNLNAPFILSREIGKLMMERKAGKIIFTASLLSFQGGINVPGYAASKGAVASLIKALANEWAGSGINVNGVAPGYIETDNTTQLRADEERNRAILSRIPAGRWGVPEDLVGAYVFLASEASSYVHGTIITVDGGWMGR